MWVVCVIYGRIAGGGIIFFIQLQDLCSETCKRVNILVRVSWTFHSFTLYYT